MNCSIPDFEMDEGYSIPTASGLTRAKKSSVAEGEIMELLWQNGQVVMQSQNQRSFKRSHIGEAVIPAEQLAPTEIRPGEESATQPFMQEDEMASWLHYPIDEDSSFHRDFYADLIYPPSCAPVVPPVRTATVPDVATMDEKSPRPASAATSRPPIPPPRREEVDNSSRLQNFEYFSRLKGRAEPGPSSSYKAAKELTVVDSSETPAAAAPQSRASHFAGNTVPASGLNLGCGSMSGATAALTSSAAGGGKGTGTFELTVTSSAGGSGSSLSGSAEQMHKPPPPQSTKEDRKRKGREVDETECQSQDVKFESLDAKKQVRGSTSTKRSRAAEVHNLSERKRRDRINEKMRALQELIPRCNKSDKASMLDEAIEYLKSLQLQVQMMSMGCSMVPMMLPGVQQYMPQMAMGMGMGMEMGMTRPMIPFPSVLAGSALPTSASAVHLGPRFSVPAFHMSHVQLPDPCRTQAGGHSDHPMLNSLGIQNPNRPRMPNFSGPYQQHLGLHQTQVPLRPTDSSNDAAKYQQAK